MCLVNTKNEKQEVSFSLTFFKILIHPFKYCHMKNKALSTIAIIILTGFYNYAQHNYLLFDYNINNYKYSTEKYYAPDLFEKLKKITSTYSGGSYLYELDNKNLVGIGIGLKKCNYEKQWVGIFPENNQFGIVVADGEIKYWSFPISYVFNTHITRKFGCGLYRKRILIRTGLTFTYTPSFVGKNTYSIRGYSASNLDSFISSYQTNVQSFQHSLKIGLCSYHYLFERNIRLEIEPYVGIGSGYFQENGTRIDNFSYGLKIRLGVSAILPSISIQKEKQPAISPEKKKQLEEKQKQIEQQLKNNPK